MFGVGLAWSKGVSFSGDAEGPAAGLELLCRQGCTQRREPQTVVRGSRTSP